MKKAAVFALSTLALLLPLAAHSQAQSQSQPQPQPAPVLTVCMVEDNPPFSMARKGQVTGLDVMIADAVARELGRELKLLPFEPELEKEAMLTHEVNALLSAGLCDVASGFPLLASDLGPPTRERFKTPDYPGAKRARDRPFEKLGTLIASQPYQGSALTLVRRAGSAPADSLKDLVGRKVAAVAGTLEGTLIAMYRGGVLARSMVSLGQRENAWEALEGGRVDAMLVPTAAFDAYRLRHPDSSLQAGAARPLGINLGWVALASRQDVIDAVNRVLQRSAGNGQLAQWAKQSGLQWLPPSEPAVAGTLSLAALLND